jgi:NAD-dependent SIR2 family protein deacetylase
MQELIRAVREKNAILFAGAGLSMNLGLPSFKQLIGKLADDLKFDPDLFYLSGDYLTLAEYYCLQKGSLGPLRSWMDTTWHDSRIDIRQSKIHKAIHHQLR